jgi:hypothetical protein
VGNISSLENTAEGGFLSARMERFAQIIGELNGLRNLKKPYPILGMLRKSAEDLSVDNVRRIC